MIDLRSDTVTSPTEAMLESMREATLGDDSRDGDPTVIKLEELAARRTGKEAAVFVPSGTMSNLVAALAHGDRGGEVLLEAGSHVLYAEMGGITNIAGMFPHRIPGQRGAMDLDALRAAIRPRLARNSLGSALIWMETTHNKESGAVLPLEHMAAVHRLGREHGIPVHTDGARLFNAAVALKVDAAQVAQHTDSVCFCVSKGLSAPVGSLLCGTRDFIELARGFRRMVGGNMRQAGPIAAAGTVALETMVERLAEDHRTARRLAQGLHKIDASLVDPANIETNIVRIPVKASGRTAAGWSAALKERNVLVSPGDIWELRFVTHRHIGDAEVDQAVSAVASLWQKF